MTSKRVAVLMSLCGILGATDPCKPPFTGTVTPSVGTYIASLEASIAKVEAQVSAVPQQKIQLDGADVYAVQGMFDKGKPCNPYYPARLTFPASPCAYNNYLVQRGYLDALSAAGVQAVDINIGLVPLESAPEYLTAWNTLYKTDTLANQFQTTAGGLYAVSMSSPGSGYAPNDVLSVVGPAGSTGGKVTVMCNTGYPCVPTGITVSAPGTGYIQATDSTSGGSGSGLMVAVRTLTPLIPPAIAAGTGTTCAPGSDYLALPIGYDGSTTIDQPNTGAAFDCYSLANLDDLIWYATSIGMKVRLAPTPGAEAVINGGPGYCGLTYTSNELQLEYCYEPLYYAAILRWGQAAQNWIDSFTSIHEPAGEWGLSLPLPPSSPQGTLSPILTPGISGTVHMFIENSYLNIKNAAVKAGQNCSPSTSCVNVGASIGTLSNNSQEATYWSDWVTNIGLAYLNYLAEDVYANTWDVSLYATPPLVVGSSPPGFYCRASTGITDAFCLGGVLSSCAPSNFTSSDSNNECSWFVSSTGSQSGAVLASAQASNLGGSPPASTCTATFAGAGAVTPATATATIAATTGAVTLSMTNVGAGYTASPTAAALSTCSPATLDGTNLTITSTVLDSYATGGALGFASNLAQSAKAANIPIRVNESNRPVYVKSGCPPTGDRGIYNNDYSEWLNDGMDVAWFDAIVPWAAANGFTSISPYATQMFVLYNSFNLNAQCTQPGPVCPDYFLPELPFFAQLGYLTGGSNPPGVSVPWQSGSGAAWKHLSTGAASSLQGNSSLQGHACLQACAP